MNRDALIVEARAKIIWGEEPLSVRAYLTSNGMSADEADAKIAELIQERNAEIRGIGIRNILIGVALLGVAGLLYYSLFATLHSHTGRRSGRGFGLMIFAAGYGLWKLVNGIISVVRPKSEHRSIPDLEE